MKKTEEWFKSLSEEGKLEFAKAEVVEVEKTKRELGSSEMYQTTRWMTLILIAFLGLCLASFGGCAVSYWAEVQKTRMIPAPPIKAVSAPSSVSLPSSQQ